MLQAPLTLAPRTVGEWAFHSDQTYPNPFADVSLQAEFSSPGGRTFSVPAFYGGDQTWRVRFNPAETGIWHFRTESRPHNSDLEHSGKFKVEGEPGLPFVTATPGQAWGFSDEHGSPVLILGDTVYNLFGAVHCGLDVTDFLRRRVEQGFNLLRVRTQVSPFHPPEAHNVWQDRRTWPWGGSEQAPLFDRFNLDYFRTVDQVVQLADSLGLGREMIMEAWGFEFPFNSRQIFTAEWEEFWLRYLIARYDAYRAVFIWTLMNEYEFYPNGDWHYQPIADRWAMRLARWVKQTAVHGHPVAVHNGPTMPPFAQRFAADPEAVDVVMFQTWGTRDAEQGWLAAGIETEIARSLEGWPGAAVFAEWGYERDPDLALSFPGFRHCDANHNRRGAWRGAFSGLGLANGFEHTWGPHMAVERDLPGASYFSYLKQFFTTVVDFAELQPSNASLLVAGDWPAGHQPLVLADSAHDVVCVYFPAGGRCRLQLPVDPPFAVRCFDPRSGELTSATINVVPEGIEIRSPDGEDALGRPLDWVFALNRQATSST